MTRAFPDVAAPWLIVTAAALIDAQGRVLVQQRPAGAAMAGLWEFPGGKVEPGETPESALVRELGEELGISVDPACLAPACFATGALATADGSVSVPGATRTLLLLLFVARKWRGQPVPHAATALRWMRPVELHGLDMPPADRPLIGPLEQLI